MVGHGVENLWWCGVQVVLCGVGWLCGSGVVWCGCVEVVLCGVVVWCGVVMWRWCCVVVWCGVVWFGCMVRWLL